MSHGRGSWVDVLSHPNVTQADREQALEHLSIHDVSELVMTLLDNPNLTHAEALAVLRTLGREALAPAPQL